MQRVMSSFSKLSYLMQALLSLAFFIIVFGIGVSWALEAIGVPFAQAATIASQASIVLYALWLHQFNGEEIKKELKDKINFPTFWNGVKLTILVLLCNLLVGAVFPVNSSEVPEQTQKIIENNSLIMTVILPIIVAPVFEELAFRAGLKRLLVDKGNWSKLSYVIVSSLIFGLMHYSPGWAGLAHVSLTALMGIVYSTVYLKTENIGIPIASHMLYNGLVVTLASLV